MRMRVLKTYSTMYQTTENAIYVADSYVTLQNKGSYI